MTTGRDDAVVFTPEDLLPGAWRHFLSQGPVRTFNPGLLRDGNGWLFAYRVVAADGVRRIALCRLDEGLRVMADSACAFSDLVSFRGDADYPEIARHWFADPRLYRWGRRVFIYWNSGWHEPRNHQFAQEIDPHTLAPMGKARELMLRGERQKLEKNWTFFQSPNSEDWRAIYSITPHRVLTFSWTGEGDIVFEPLAETAWTLPEYPAHHGGLRGGAPPVLADGQFWTFCHSVHDGGDGYRYLPAVYCFAPTYPFAPTARPTRPLVFPRGREYQRTWERLNPAVGEVIYPCGAARDGARWMVSHGINDESCGISLLPHASIEATLATVAQRNEFA